MRSLLKDKRGKGGSEGLDKAIAFMGALIVLGILGFVLIIIAGNLLTVGNTTLPTLTQNIVNETLTTVTDLEGGGDLFAAETLSGVVCTISVITNNTIDAAEPAVIGTGNYTTTGTGGCGVYWSGLENSGGFNNSDWNVTYTDTYRSSDIDNTLRNLSSGTATFFGNVPVWFGLVSIVIIIILIAAVVFITKKFRSSGGGVTKSGTPNI